MNRIILAALLTLATGALVLLQISSTERKLTPLYRLSHPVYSYFENCKNPVKVGGRVECDEIFLFTDHMWTTDPAERDGLIKDGWTLESIPGHGIMVVQK